MEKVNLAINKRLIGVKEIKEIRNWKEVNALLDKGWILICIYQSEGTIMYSMGRINN